MPTATQTLAATLDAEKVLLATSIVDRQWLLNPHFDQKYGEAGHAKCVRDVGYNLAYLSDAVSTESQALFTTYIEWLRTLFAGLNIPEREIVESLELTREVLSQRLSGADSALVNRYLDAGLERLSLAHDEPASLLDEPSALFPLAHGFFNALRQGNRTLAAALIHDAVRDGAGVKDIYLQVFQPSQREVGRLWQLNQMSVAQEHYCTAATQLIMAQLYPQVFGSPRNGHRMVATGVGGELHEIGLRMVADFFEMEGWDTYYVGPNLPASSVVDAVVEHGAEVLSISATMTFHLKLVAELIAQVRALSRVPPVKILVGGFAFNLDQNLWRQVGADGYASDAAGAIQTATALLAA